MTEKRESALPRHVGSWLAAYCDGEATDGKNGPLPTAAPSPDPFLARFERALDCLWLLDQVWPDEQDLVVTNLGAYRIVSKLGQGGMGEVYRAVHTLLKRPVALKILRRNRTGDAQAVRRFYREMEAVGKLDHANIVRASDAGQFEGTHYLAMELVDGIDLGKLVERHGPLEVRDACEIGRQIAVALEHVNQHGLVHRDLKPSNVMLSRHGGIKLLDLGLARLVLEDPDTQPIMGSYRFIGTEDYMAPEQAAGPSGVDIRADLYSLGCVLSKLLTGQVHRKPDSFLRQGESGSVSKHPAETSSQNHAILPDDVQQVLRRLLATERSDRFPTPAEVEKTLSPWARGHDLEGLARRSCLVTVPEESFNAPDVATVGGFGKPHAAPKLKRLSTQNRRWQLGASLAGLTVVMSALALALPSGSLSGPQLSKVGSLTAITNRHSSIEVPKLGTWNLAPSGDPLPGLVPQPANLSGVGRWQVDTVAPRGFVYGMAWSPDGRLLAVGSSDHYIRVYEAATQRLVHVFAGHTRNIPCLAWSPDGRWLASAGGFKDWSVRLWSIPDGKPGPMIETHWGAQSVTWSPDGRRLAIARRSPTDQIQVWDPFDLTLIASFTHQSHRLFSVAWSPNGKWIAALGDDALRLWDAQTGSPGRTFPGAQDEKKGHFTQLLAWSPDSRWIAAPGSHRTIHTYDVSTGDEGPVLEGHSDAVKSVAWSPDGQRVASGGFDATIRLWDVETGKQQRVLKHAWWVASVAWRPDGERIASGSRNGTVRLWDSATGELIWEIGSKWEAEANTSWASVAWSPDGTTLATGGADSNLRLWDAGGAELQGAWQAHEGPVHWVRWKPDGSRLVSASYGPYGSIKVWDVSNRAATIALQDSVTGAPEWSPDGRRLAVPGYRNVQIYDAASGAAVRSLRGQTGNVLAVAWSPDGAYLTSGGSDQTVRLWSAKDGQLQAVLKDSQEAVGWLSWNAESHAFAAASMTQGKSGALHRWGLDAGSAHFEGVFAIEKWFPTAAWCPGTKWLATGHNTGDVWIRDSYDATPAIRLAGHAEVVRQVAWSPNAGRLASVSDDYTLRVWDTASGNPLWFSLLLANGRAAAFSANGELLNPDTEVQELLVYLVEEPSGALRLLPSTEFDELVAR